MLKIKTVLSEKIWGGSKLKELGFDVENGKRIGEAWVISAYNGNSSPIEGMDVTLRDLYKTNRELFNDYKSEEFPLLAKILDAGDYLSIQVHPDNKKALELDNYPFGKTECWYILEAGKDTDIIIDINAKTKEEAAELIENKEWDKLLKYQDIKKGDIFEIEAGTVHAIGPKTVLYELQQSSDLTYRLYDFDRPDVDGKLRELHIDKSLEVIKYGGVDFKREEKLLSEKNGSKIHSLINNPLFDLEKWEIKEGIELSFDKEDKNFLMITIIEGKAEINGVNFNSFESGIITSDELGKITIKGDTIILVGNPK